MFRLIAFGLVGLTLGPFAALPFALAAVPTDCVEDGGMAVCSEPVIVPISPAAPVDSESWSYALCDEQALYLSREYWWCVVRSGTWDTSDPVHPQCLNAQPVLDSVVYVWSKAFEGLAHNACSTNDGADTGWGTAVASAYCWTGSTLTRNGIAIRQFRKLGPFSGTMPRGRCDTAWSEGVSARRDRNLVCPQGYASRQKPGAPAGDLQCYYLPACCESIGNPINPALGNKTLVERDFVAPAQSFGLGIVRYYNNAGFYRGGPVARPSQPTAADFWRTDYDRRLHPIIGRTSTMASVQREDGSVQYFAPGGRQVHNIAGGADRLEKLVDDGGGTIGWRHTSASRDVEVYEAGGALRSITFRSGMVHTLVYSDASTPSAIAPFPGLLIGVTDSFGHSLGFTYDTLGRRISARDPLGQLYRYSYDAAGNLSSVVYPDQTTRSYVYGEASNNCGGTTGACSYLLLPWTLTGIVDENGKRFATYVYASGNGAAVRSEHADGADRFAVGYASNRATITDALGTQRTTTYQQVQGVTKVLSVTQPCGTPGCAGNVTRGFTYDAAGNVASVTDFDGRKTCYAYDGVRNLELARVEGVKTELCSAVLAALPVRPDVRRISTQWHPSLRLPTKVAEPNRIVTNAYNGDGGVYCAPVTAIDVLCTRTIQGTSDPTGQEGLAASPVGTPRSWQYTYNQYGRVLTATDPMGKTTRTVYYSANDPDASKAGNVRTVTNAVGHVTTFAAYDLAGRPTTIVDANGVTTSLSYSPRGWLETRNVAGEPTIFDYDPVGQLSRVTRPDGSYLQYAYDDAHRLIGVQDGLGNTMVYTLDAIGNRVKEEAYDPEGTRTLLRQRVYDSFNRVHQSVGAQ